MIRAGIFGASGYGGGELLRLLAGHPQVESVRGVSRSLAGRPIHQAHPNLRGLFEGDFAASMDWSWLSDCESPVLFCAMPHGELASIYEELAAAWTVHGLEGRLRVIDLSADFRIRGQASPWVYGLPEWNTRELRGANRIANPGCFATALQLGLLPLSDLPIDGGVAAFGVTGSSGSGMRPSETTHHPTRSHDFRAYKVLTHQHMEEVRQALGWWGRSDQNVSFVPHSAPMVRGILVTLQFTLAEDASTSSVFESRYEHAPFVRLTDGSPRVASVIGSNFADIGVVQEGRQAAVLVAIDNLVKGMAGQAVQNLNLSLGRPETEGLWYAGAYPA